MHSYQQEPVRRKSTAVGWVLLILGVIGVIIALVLYPTWTDNKDTLAWKEAFGLDTDEDHNIVAAQTLVVLGGLLVGIPMLMGGVYLVWSASSYNARLDNAMIGREYAVQHQGYPQQPQSSYPSMPPQQHQVQQDRQPQKQSPRIRYTQRSSGFCDQCGAPLKSDSKFCPGCGRNLEKRP